MVLFSKVVSFGRELRVFLSKVSISSAVRENTSLGLDMVMLEVEVKVTGERRDSRVMSDPEMMG